MLLVPFVALLTLGFGSWLLGHYFQYTGIASIGAVLIIAVGGAVALTDLQMKAGHTVDNEYVTVDNETVVDNASVSYTYETVSISSELGGAAGPLSIGGLVMVIGGLLMTHHLNEIAQ